MVEGTDYLATAVEQLPANLDVTDVRQTDEADAKLTCVVAKLDDLTANVAAIAVSAQVLEDGVQRIEATTDTLGHHLLPSDPRFEE
ncbi:MAG TPA: hypothetical protein VGV07_18035 [Devosia sp.]|uniref:hypothetical protein n=1 Tax=Devosia sp. TaxID=1871048 RepID=UPI002DDD8287|nr:hypothetical protein [Devosia sp.]HEV2517159.1 hypothetical protein [Devosia sp.]